MAALRRVKPPAPRFSVVTIVRNEAGRLPRLLDSLAAFRASGGEVVVLDTGSEDGTPEVARAAGCRVAVEAKRFNTRLTPGQARRINRTFSREGEGPFVAAGERLFNFAGARNCAAALARRHFLLALDGGDVVDALDLDWIDATLREGRAAAYRFETRVRNRAGWSVELHDCFYDRRRLEWKGRAHNHLVPIQDGPPPPAILLPRERLRVSHHTDLDKPRGYQLAGAALSALADPGHVRWPYFLGRELASRGHVRSALPLLVSLDRPTVSPATRSSGLCLAARCLEASGAPADEIDALLFRAVRRDSGRREPLMRLARRRLAAGDLQGATSFAAAALAIPAQAGVSEPEADHREGPHAVLYWALFWLGRRAEARAHFEACRRLDPGNPAYREHERLFEPGTKRASPPARREADRPRAEKARGRAPRRALSFSIVSIMRNEASRLPRLLASIDQFRGRGGEVLVLDTGSEDGTPAVAEAGGCRVRTAGSRFDRRVTEGQAERVHRAFSRGGEGPFLLAGERLFDEAAARNCAASMALNDFQLAVDGSDVAEAMDLDFLDAIVRSGSSPLLRFETRRLHEGRWFVETRDYFHDRRVYRWAGRAHNFVIPSRPGVLRGPALLPRDRLRIAHHTEAGKERIHQLAGVLLDALEWPDSRARGFLVGRELAIRGHFKSAQAAFLALDREGSSAPLRSAALCMAASCLSDPSIAGSEEAIADLLFTAARRDPSRRDPLLQLARRATARGDFQGAASFAEAALAIPSRASFAELEENLHDGPHAILYWALFWLGRRSEARAHFRICRGLDPQNPTYRDHARLFGEPIA